MSESSYAFKTHVWPEVRSWCREGRLEIVESSTAKGLLHDFDTLAGIDAWQLLDDHGYMRGIASRVQVGAAWGTFTVRKSRSSGARTEFEKRVEAIRKQREGALYPALTIHAYVRDYRNGPLLSAAMVYTADLYKYLEIAISEGRANTRKASNAEFYWVSWQDLDASGVQIRTTEPYGNGNDVLQTLAVARAAEFGSWIPSARQHEEEARDIPERERERRQE
jgi:hypothetical protein